MISAESEVWKVKIWQESYILIGECVTKVLITKLGQSYKVIDNLIPLKGKQ